MNGNAEVIGAATMAAYMFASFVAGGGTVLLATGLLARYILNSPVLVAYLEHIANGASPELVAALRDTGQLVVEATDGIPAESKTVTTTTTETPA